MNPTEEHDDLWQLLGKARQPAGSPFFSRNILREVRALRQEKPGLSAWLRRHWRVAAFAACGLVIVAGAVFSERQHEEYQLSAFADRVSSSPDYQVIAHLDELMDSEQNSVWLEGTTY